MNAKNEKQQSNDAVKNNENTDQQNLDVKNPFDSNDDKTITQEDIDNEQTFKEAQTERD